MFYKRRVLGVFVRKNIMGTENPLSIKHVFGVVGVRKGRVHTWGAGTWQAQGGSHREQEGACLIFGLKGDR